MANGYVPCARDVNVSLHLHDDDHCVIIHAEVRTVGPTGVEMEALTAAAVSALTVYDMCKAVCKAIVVTDLRLEYKSGGKSGTYQRSSKDG